LNHYPADFGPLCELLQQQLTQYMQLLNLAEQKRDCLVKLNVDKLERLVRAETVQLRHISLLETKRLVATGALAAVLGYESPHTINGLISYAEGARQNQLQQLRDDFEKLIPRLSAAHEANRALLQTNMALNDLMLGFMTGPEDPLNNFYGADGSEPEEKISSPIIIDQQV